MIREYAIDVKGTNASRLEHFTMRPQFKDAHIITSDLLAVELSKCKVLYNKPTAVGAAILGISKHKMTFQHLKSKDHTLTTETVERIGLCPYDDKSWVCDDGITSYAHGHYKTKTI
jgi:hypothetical protein